MIGNATLYVHTLSPSGLRLCTCSDSDDFVDDEDMEDDNDEDEIALDIDEQVETAATKKARQEEEIHTEHIEVLERLKAKQRGDYLKGTVSGSVQATDRLMKELRDIYKSPSFKTGNYQVRTYILSKFRDFILQPLGRSSRQILQYHKFYSSWMGGIFNLTLLSASWPRNLALPRSSSASPASPSRGP